MNKLISMIYLEPMNLRHDCRPYIRIYKLLGNLKLFTEDIKLPITADKPDEVDCSVRNIVDLLATWCSVPTVRVDTLPVQ
jgi:hypothetical protein